MLFTMSHEMTHFVRHWSPSKYQKLANFLVEEFSEKYGGETVDQLVHKKMKDTKLEYDDAFEEVVADAMETMLTDGNLVEKLAKLKKQDKTLWQRLKDFVKEWHTKLKAAYEVHTPESAEGQMVAAMVDSIDQLQQLFAEGLVEASENYKAGQDKDVKEADPVAMAASERTDAKSSGNPSEQDLDEKIKYSRKITERQLEDKYYARQIEQWDGKDHGGSFRVGRVSEPLLKIGIPDVDIWFDQSKAAKQLEGKDEVNKDVLKKIPYLLEHPIAISESYDNTVMVFGEMYDKSGNPIVVALRVNSTNRRNHITLVNKIRSVGTRTHNLDKLLADEAILYLNEAKKETNRWFNALGRSTPFGGTKFGLIRSISFDVEKSNIVQQNNSAIVGIKEQNRDTESVSNRSLLANALESAAVNDKERQKLQEYKEKIGEIQEAEEKLRDLNAQIRDELNHEQVKKLRIEARQTLNRLEILDRQILRTEAELKPVLDREQKMAYLRGDQKHHVPDGCIYMGSNSRSLSTKRP